MNNAGNNTRKSKTVRSIARFLILTPLITTVLGLSLFIVFRLVAEGVFDPPKIPFELAVILINAGDILLLFSLTAGIPMSVVGMVLAIKQKVKVFIVLSVIIIILILFIYLAIIAFFALNEGLFARTHGTYLG